MSGEVPIIAHLYQDPFSDEAAVLIDARKVNEALLQLGCEVRLRWKSEESTKGRKRHTLVRGRFRLGQHKGTVPASIFRNPRQALHPLQGFPLANVRRREAEAIRYRRVRPSGSERQHGLVR